METRMSSATGSISFHTPVRKGEEPTEDSLAIGPLGHVRSEDERGESGEEEHETVEEDAGAVFFAQKPP